MTLTKLGQMCSKTCRVSMLFLLILILFELYFRPSLYIKSIYYLILSHYTSQFWGFGVLTPTRDKLLSLKGITCS